MAIQYEDEAPKKSSTIVYEDVPEPIRSPEEQPNRKALIYLKAQKTLA